MYLGLGHPEALVKGHLAQPRLPVEADERADAVVRTCVRYAQAEGLDVLEDLAYAVGRHHEHPHIEADEPRDGLLGEPEAEEGAHGRAHVLLQVGHEAAWGTVDRVADVGVGAEDAAEELDAGDEVLVETAREEERRGGELPLLDAEGGEEVKLGAEDPVRVEGEDQRESADYLSDVRVGESIAAEERADGVGPVGAADAKLVGSRGERGESAGDQIGDGGGAGLRDGAAGGDG